MIKNMTRKGLAIGATAALTLAGLVGFAAPASATTGITVEPSKGTSYSMISGEQLDLRVFGQPNYTGGFDNLRWEVTNPDEVTVTRKVPANAGATADTRPASNPTAGATSDADKFVVVPLAATTATGGNQLGLSVAVTEATTLQVRAFIDLNGNGAYDAGTDLSANVVNVTFVKPADVTWTTTLTAPALGDTKVVSNVTASNNINLAQLASKVTVGHAKLSGATYTHLGVSASTGDDVADAANTAGNFTKGEATTFVSATNSLKAELTHTVSAGTYVAQAVYGFVEVAVGADTAGTEIGSESRSAVAPATVVRIDTPVVASAGNVIGGTTATPSVRNGTSSLNVSVQLYSEYTSASDNKPATAGTPVKITISESTATGNTDAATFSAGGKTLSDTTAAVDKIEFDLVAGSDGKVSFDIAVAGTVAGVDAIVVNATSQGVSSVTQGNSTISFIATTAGQMVNTNVLGTNAIMKVAPGSSYTLTYAVLDNFGTPLTGSYRVALNNGATTVFGNVNNGQVSFALTDSTTLTGSYSAQLQVLDTSTQNYDPSGSAVTFTPTVGTSAAAGATTLVATGSDSNTTALVLNNNDLSSADTRLGQTAPTVVTPAASAAANVATLSGQVSDAQGVFTYSSVTLSAPGVLFNAGDVYRLGSITVQTNATGFFDGVKLYSNTSGKVTITATAGAATKTVDVTFVAAADNSGANVSVVVSNAVAGSTMKVVTTITDKFGNPVDSDQGTGAVTPLSIVYDGPGFIVGGSTPTATDADGTATFFVFLGNNDVVTGSVTATYAGTSRSLATTTDNITTVANFGATSETGTARAWTRFIDASSELKIYARDVIGAGKVQFVVNGREIAWIRATDATDPKLNVANDGMVRSVFVRNMLQGRNVIEIFVDGERVVRRIFTR